MTFPKTALRLMIPAIFLLMSLNSQAQDSEYSARLRIMQAGVEIRRVNTTEWLPLPLNAEAPLGTGDSLRTDGTGRALLTFLENVEVLILTETTVDIVTFQAANDHLQLALKVQG
ncbi:MAG: hypothetical protein K8I30_15765, partial [Anaerolineae bacterium]|nr:hypothetical protein [Anaerolineae bacterium]